MQRAALRVGFGFVLLLAGCAGDRPDIGDSGPLEQDAAADTAAEGTAPPYCPAPGHAPGVGKLCVVGTTLVDAGVDDASGPDEDDAGSGKPGYRLIAGEPVRFWVFPEGCFSDRCVRVDEAVCSVASADGSKITLSGAFCLKPKSGQTCGSDCSGGGVGECSAESLAAGSYTATLGALSVSFTIPSEVPNAGLCTGE